MDIKAAEISAILKDQIKDFGKDAQVSEVGQVLSVGDGIARVFGLDKVQAGELVEFPGGIKGMALNLEADNVGVVIFGSDRDIKEGDTVKAGQAVLITEAMKTETEVQAPIAGTVKAVHVAKGDRVNPGEVLTEVEA